MDQLHKRFTAERVKVLLRGAPGRLSPRVEVAIKKELLQEKESQPHIGWLFSGNWKTDYERSFVDLPSA